MNDPIELFQNWLREAVDVGIAERLAMTIATIDVDGHPDARMLLLRGCDERGFAFYTNMESPKARALLREPPNCDLLLLGQDRQASARTRPRCSRER